MTDRGNADEARESEQRRLGEAVKIRRLVFDMSQNQLAVKAGLSVSVLGGIERGTEPLTARSIVKLAGALGWPADWPQAIRNGEDPETGNTTMFGASELSVSPYSPSMPLQIAAKAERLTPKQRELVESMIDELLEE